MDGYIFAFHILHFYNLLKFDVVKIETSLVVINNIISHNMTDRVYFCSTEKNRFILH